VCTTIVATSRSRTWAIQHRDPLLAVMAWELRRLRASRLLWLHALGLFALSLFLTWALKIPLTLNHDKATVIYNGFVAGTSAWGLILTLPTGTLLLLGMLLPFVNADGVTRDRSQRTHELLLATALPTGAYVWGRYLVGLLISLALAALALIAILVMGVLLHLTITDYPMPQLGPLLVIWIGLIASATVLVSSLSFALGTVLPRLVMLVKLAILLAWFLASQVPAILFNQASHAATFSLPAWYVQWDPTSEGIALGWAGTYFAAFSNLASAATSTAQNQHAILLVENSLIDLRSWFVPHLLLAGFGLVLALVTALVFKRSRNSLN
jgi:ABC-type transport system involved in multi-copper enzyme maturation permease subunit